MHIAPKEQSIVVSTVTNRTETNKREDRKKKRKKCKKGAGARKLKTFAPLYRHTFCAKLQIR